MKTEFLEWVKTSPTVWVGIIASIFIAVGITLHVGNLATFFITFGIVMILPVIIWAGK